MPLPLGDWTLANPLMGVPPGDPIYPHLIRHHLTASNRVITEKRGEGPVTYTEFTVTSNILRFILEYRSQEFIHRPWNFP